MDFPYLQNKFTSHGISPSCIHIPVFKTACTVISKCLVLCNNVKLVNQLASHRSMERIYTCPVVQEMCRPSPRASSSTVTHPVVVEHCERKSDTGGQAVPRRRMTGERASSGLSVHHAPLTYHQIAVSFLFYAWAWLARKHWAAVPPPPPPKAPIRVFTCACRFPLRKEAHLE